MAEAAISQVVGAPVGVRVAEGVTVRDVADEAVVIDITNGRYLALDDIARSFWRAVTEYGPTARAVDALVEEFAADHSVIEADFGAFVVEALDLGLLVQEGR